MRFFPDACSVVRIHPSGLGNQLFDYAFGLYLERTKGHKVVYVLPNRQGPHAGFVLKKLFGIPDNVATRWDLFKALGPLALIYSDNRVFGYLSKFTSRIHHDTDTPKILGDQLELRGHFFAGMWQHWGYVGPVAEMLKARLQPALRKLCAEFKQPTEIDDLVIHCRFGDFYSSTWANRHAVDLRLYYRRSIEYFVEHHNIQKIRVVSDDPERAITTIRELAPATVAVEPSVSENGFKGDMLTLSAAKYLVCSNSTFSWWMALLNLNPNPVITFPDEFLVNDFEQSKSMVVPGWKVIGTR